MKSRKQLLLVLFSLALLSACGGGGGSSSSFTSGSGTQTAALTITTASPLATAIQGRAYSATLAATGGQGALHWSIAPAPPGLSIDASTGVLSGAPTVSGDAGFIATVTDSSTPARTATKFFDLRVNHPLAVSASNTVFPIQYFQQAIFVSITGGVTPYKVLLDPTCLPPGMKPNPANTSTSNAFPTLALGVPLAAGTYTCTITVQDSFSPPESAAQALTMNIAIANLVVGTTLPAKLLLNRPVAGRVAADGGTPPYSYSLNSGPLPPGLLFDASTGQISGTPSSLGEYRFFVQVSDSGSPQKSASQFFDVNVVQAVGRNDSPATATSLDSNAGTGFAFATGSISPYIDPPDGTPSAADQDYYRLRSLGGAVVHIGTSILGNSPIDTVIEIVDGNGAQLSTCRQPGDTTPNLTSVCVNDDVSPGNLNSGLNFQVPGASNALQDFYIHVLDWRGDARPDMMYLLSISGIVTPLQITGPTSLSGKVGLSYAATLNASGGTRNYSWSVVSGTLPPGMSLASYGLLSLQGAFTTTGTYVFDVQVADAGPPAQTAKATFTLTVTN